MENDLSVIIVNWNGGDFLLRCLGSLPSACGVLSHETWVVDNASMDSSADLVRALFPGVNLIASPRNLGFAAANNLACRNARGRYLLLLNPDTEPEPNSIAGLLAYADAHPKIGIVGPQLLNSDGSRQRSCWRGYPGISMAIVDAFYLWKLHRIPLGFVSEYRPEELGAPRQVDHLLGAAMLIRREAWEQVGPLKESYFLGAEETDWCYRASQLGWQIVYHPSFKITHHGQRSLWQQPERTLPFMYSGYCQFYATHHRSHVGLPLLVGILAAGALIRTALWTARWAKAREEDRRRQARRMIAGYLQVIRRLPGQLWKPWINGVLSEGPPSNFPPRVAEFDS